MSQDATPPNPPQGSRTARPFPPRRDYTSLSVGDLLDARDAYHVHLSRLENVVATAIGRYLIHKDDWYATNPPDRPRPANVDRIHVAKTLANTVVRPWSWPSVLVFVRAWGPHGQPGDEVVPRSLYMPDGRVVPTCLILAPPDEGLPAAAAPPGPSRASGLLGGAYACLREHQGEQNVGTLGCLVKKDGNYYALTSRHVAGGEGEKVRAYIRAGYHTIGRSSNIAVGRLSMPSVFGSWRGDRTQLNFDAALVRIEDIGDWTAQVFGIGEIGELFNATEQSVTLDLIGCPVRAFGGVSGVMEGEIQALFFRYQSLGGIDQATDVLIGPKKREKKEGGEPDLSEPYTHPGDSGTLWFYDPPSEGDEPRPDDDVVQGHAAPDRGPRARRLRPVAMQWGGQRLLLPDGSSNVFALASFMSSICRALDVDVVRDWSTGHDEYWGKIGHFAIGYKACNQVSESSEP